MASVSLTLYLTTDCALCENALDLIFDIQFEKSVSLETVDIALDDQLFEQYGERIPVLSINQVELDWPFSAEEILKHLAMGE